MQNAQVPSRIASIDVFRALTMLLMLFVNTLHHVHDAPAWMNHSPLGTDAMGLADIVFPCFLFIVGMSVPFAIKSRKKKGDSDFKILLHIAIRTVALLIMGVFHENIYHNNPELSGLNSYFWIIAVHVCFVLVWNVYPENKIKLKWLFKSLKIFGFISLIVLAFMFRGGTVEETEYFTPRWWGILGLIGWTYLICSIVYLFAKNKMRTTAIALIFFLAYNIVSHIGVFEVTNKINAFAGFLGKGGFVSMTFGGILTSLLFVRAKEKDAVKMFYMSLIVLTAVSFILGVLTRPYWGISKINDTPAWILFSLSASFAVFCFLFWFIDVKGNKRIFDIIKPAGTSTLLCYLLPYFYEPSLVAFNISYPDFLSNGIPGLVWIFVVSMLLIIATGLLERIGIKMKL